MYKPGDKLVLEIKNCEETNIRGEERIYSVEGMLSLFSEYALNKLDRLDADYINEHYGELQDEAYQQGMNDAWEIAKKLYLNKKNGGLSDVELEKIFGQMTTSEIFLQYTPREVEAKIEAWEKAKQEIKVGDVVMDTENDVFVVLRKLDDFVYALLNSKGKHKYSDAKYLTKTGRAIDIASVLEKIGGTV